MTKYSRKIFVIFLTMIIATVQAQTGSYLDPGQAYVKLLIENGNNTAQRIGIYKVIGTSFLFGQKHAAEIFEYGGKKNIFLSYNTFNQELECYSSLSQDKPVIKDLDMVDSFTLKKGNVSQFSQDLHFINGTLLGASEKNFFQVVERGKRFNLYKRYKSGLIVVSTNYGQSDLRQYDLEYIYYYTDSTTKKMNKLKSNPYNIKKEFSSIMDISQLVDESSFAQNPENCLKAVFISLNNNSH